MSGWRAAASDQDFGPLTTTSTNPARVPRRADVPWHAGQHVVPADPALVRRAVEVADALAPLRGRRRSARPGRCLRRGSSRRRVSGRPRRRSARQRQSRGRTSHHRASASSPPVSTRHLALKRRSARPEGRTDLRTFVACVPLGFRRVEASFRVGFRDSSEAVTSRQSR